MERTLRIVHNHATTQELKLICATTGEAYELTQFHTIGRDEACHIQLFDPKVSKRHCRLEKKSNQYFIKDLRSTNGTWVNGISVMEAEVFPGDQILIGDTELSLSDAKAKKVSKKELSSNAPLSSHNLKWNKELSKLPKLSRSSLPLLILGPTGSGKEILAESIHKLSELKGRFVAINCGAINPSLIESEFFGHKKGSFTGAIDDRQGAFEAARGGTLFLDEIGDLPLDLQPQLLRALENKEIKSVGSDQFIKTEVRIVAATHKNLENKVKTGEFREDLFFRLQSFILRPPALIERIEDFETFVFLFAKKYKISISAEAILRLKKHSWPGNIRELKQFIEKAAVLSDTGKLELKETEELLPEDNSKLKAYGSYNEKTYTGLPQLNTQNIPPALKDIEKDIILKRLRDNNGNQRKTALELGLPKSTLCDKLKRYRTQHEA